MSESMGLFFDKDVSYNAFILVKRCVERLEFLTVRIIATQFLIAHCVYKKCKYPCDKNTNVH